MGKKKVKKKKGPSINSRRKGHSFEREIAIEFRKIGFTDARRHLEYHTLDAQGFDLDNVEPYLVQCKRGRTYACINRIEEIQDPYGQYIPLLITQADNKPIMAVLPLSDLLPLLKAKKRLTT